MPSISYLAIKSWAGDRPLWLNLAELLLTCDQDESPIAFVEYLANATVERPAAFDLQFHRFHLSLQLFDRFS